ncbi:MAG: alanine dehydrogenase [Flavobacteriia bacterium]|nr:alanine dehydrogenase [Flavobacteriia bacterium]OIP46120.1 MAG: alanine dehydrogenase [Flavobacteriaceae bacterium CG2_30_31_66]PIV96924.1 MAG: alanine dehydrogenase [Flavobacteriaceae bacterium CG17_big_fil_post_rev_8_21_14_2_50_31_13]PIX12488.1 MAG: alanine dehydrogenase [Flavobacteriaceae bacterium CG_4_8_14_3_um_filter_31_8]PIY15230.1 MAG: alanine dehydrogenase [Flavobacteriaceae bacterium CG_4_10_14_3_um_filter_31_253]PIZ11982.1 MAG: alanine dehydrogenase [Flavobacteriaceae bacterium C
MIIGILKERKNPPDKRVVFSPEKLQELKRKFPSVSIKVESSDIRVFSDEAYKNAGFEVVDDLSDCAILLGVKEVPVDALIPDKKYFFFSHTIKKQSYNRKLLQAILSKNIELYDHETIVKENGARLIGFGRYAGIVGTYNGFSAIGLKKNSFHLPKSSTLANQNALIEQLQKINLPNLKILLTGSGKVAFGAKEMLDGMCIKQVSVNEFLQDNFFEPVFCMIDVLDYNKRKDGQVLDIYDFYNHPEAYESYFFRFAKVTDFFIAGHFFGDGSPILFTKENAKHPDCKIQFIADISCDINGPIASTIRASTIENPIYGYDPITEKEVDFTNKNAIVVMAVDNLPCELPKDASEGFGEMFLEHVIPAFFDGDKNGILHRAKITENGKLTPRFSYLQEYVDGF